MTQVIFMEEFGKAFVPKRFRPRLRGYFLKAGLTDVPYNVFGALFYLALIITFILYFWKIYPLFFENPALSRIFLYTLATWILAPLALSGFFMLSFYFYLDLRIYNRTRRMEKVLPDFLRLVAENLKGGMPFERALWSAIRPEFDVLSGEVRLAAKRVMTGEDVEDALKSFTHKYNSPMLRRSFDLVIEGIKSGGEIADLIGRVVDDLEETAELKQEMSTTNLSYVIFISVIVILVAPGLFTLSFQFLTILLSLSERVGSAAASTDLPINLGAVAIDPDVFQDFSRYALAILSVFSAMIISQINRGDIKGGVKYIPMFLVLTQVFYALFMAALGSVFSGFLA